MTQGYTLDGDSIEKLREDHLTLQQMVNPQLRRRLITRPSGSPGARPYIITELTADSPPKMVAIYGPSTPAAITAKPANGATDITQTDNDIDVVPSITNGVTFTGCLCYVASVSGQNVMITAEAGTVFDGEAAEEILPDATGDVDITYIDHFGDTRTATVEVENDIGITATNGAAVIVEFIWGSQRFRISEVLCPS